MSLPKRAGLAILLVAMGTAVASNFQDEQVVRNAYAKLAYAVQSKTVYDAARRNPDIATSELNKELQANELRFDIAEMSSGALSEIASRPYSDFVTRPDTQDTLLITHDEETFSEVNGKRAISNFATARWTHGHSTSEERWDTPVKDAIALAGNEGKFSRYVAATITVRYQGRSRTYHTLWLFGSELLAVDLVSGDNAPTQYATENVFPSVLTDTSLRSRTAVDQWLNSTQRFEGSCTAGKVDVCCDAAMHCGVSAEDLRSTKPAPNTTAAPKEKIQ